MLSSARHRLQIEQKIIQSAILILFPLDETTATLPTALKFFVTAWMLNFYHLSCGESRPTEKCVSQEVNMAYWSKIWRLDSIVLTVLSHNLTLKCYNFIFRGLCLLVKYLNQELKFYNLNRNESQLGDNFFHGNWSLNSVILDITNHGLLLLFHTRTMKSILCNLIF